MNCIVKDVNSNTQIVVKAVNQISITQLPDCSLQYPKKQSPLSSPIHFQDSSGFTFTNYPAFFKQGEPVDISKLKYGSTSSYIEFDPKQQLFDVTTPHASCAEFTVDLMKKGCIEKYTGTNLEVVSKMIKVNTNTDGYDETYCVVLNIPNGKVKSADFMVKQAVSCGKTITSL